MNRLGIFCVYDKDGVIDDYIIYLLQEITKVLGHLSIICNGKLSDEGRERLRQFTDDITVRPNKGFDMGAWRQGILSVKKSLSDYDELVLFNDSFYGPFYPFDEVFTRMDSEYPDADFWGITVHRKTTDPSGLCPYGYLPEHLQSYFLVIRSRLLHTDDFVSYWENAGEARTMEEAVKKYEVCFTKHFFDKGFNYAAYCDTRDWEPDYTVSTNHYIMSVERLLKRYHCPILKKKVLLVPRSEYLNENYGDGAHKSLDFIKNHTDYDTSMIWHNILRIHNVAAIKTILSLNYILPNSVRLYNTSPNFSDVAVIAHLYYEDLISECVKYLCNTPTETTLIVTVDTAEKKSAVEKLFKLADRKCDVRIVEGRGRDLSALLVGCADVFAKFKYLCFIHDKKSLRTDSSICNGDAFFHMLWDNTLPSENFIRDVLSIFESESNLGLLVPPPPHHGDYKLFAKNYWSSDCFGQALKLAERLGITASFLNRNYSPPAVGSVFWCRTAALKKVFSAGWRVEDFPEEPMPVDGTISHGLERIFPFAAQSEGFYTGWLMTSDFANNAFENFVYMYSNFEYPISPYFLMFVLVKDILSAPNSPENSARLNKLKHLAKGTVSPKYWGILNRGKNLLAKFMQISSRFKGN